MSVTLHSWTSVRAYKLINFSGSKQPTLVSHPSPLYAYTSTGYQGSRTQLQAAGKYSYLSLCITLKMLQICPTFLFSVLLLYQLRTAEKANCEKANWMVKWLLRCIIHILETRYHLVTCNRWHKILSALWMHEIHINTKSAAEIQEDQSKVSWDSLLKLYWKTVWEARKVYKWDRTEKTVKEWSEGCSFECTERKQQRNQWLGKYIDREEEVDQEICGCKTRMCTSECVCTITWRWRVKGTIETSCRSEVIQLQGHEDVVFC